MLSKIPLIKCQVVREGYEDYIENAEAIISPSAAVKVFQQIIGKEDREHFGALLLNTKNKVIGYHTVSIGSLNTSIVHPREVFKAAIVAGAAAIIVGHNHPSGDITPSIEDKDTTKRLSQSGELLGIRVLDSFIVSPGKDYYSFAENNLI